MYKGCCSLICDHYKQSTVFSKTLWLGHAKLIGWTKKRTLQSKAVEVITLQWNKIQKVGWFHSKMNLWKEYVA